MFEIIFYKDKNGVEPVREYIVKLAKKKGKENRIRLNKIQDYMGILCQYGTRAGEPYMKHLEGDIWELRPLSDRILFVVWTDNRFVLLHHFVKKTPKTPKREIERAKRHLADFVERGEDDE